MAHSAPHRWRKPIRRMARNALLRPTPTTLDDEAMGMMHALHLLQFQRALYSIEIAESSVEIAETSIEIAESSVDIAKNSV